MPSISITIHGQRLDLNIENTERLYAAKHLVDQKLEAIKSSSASSSKVLALLALSLADDIMKTKESHIEEQKVLKNALERVSSHAEALADVSLR